MSRMIDEELMESFMNTDDSMKTLTNGEDNSYVSESTRSSDEDGICGEPLLPQQVLIDFTPGDMDSEYIQMKCIEFWKVIDSEPKFNKLMVTPGIKLSESTISSVTSKPEIKMDKPDLTAVSMLGLLDEKGLINRVFEAKMPQSHCTLRSVYNSETEFAKEAKLEDRKSKGICKCTEKCKCLNKTAAPLRVPSINVQGMCKEFEKWDDKHPKSMEPPGHAPEILE